MICRTFALTYNNIMSVVLVAVANMNEFITI